MGLYYSEDMISTLDFPSTTILTPKGVADTHAAIIIQRWWRRIRKNINTNLKISSKIMIHFKE